MNYTIFDIETNGLLEYHLKPSDNSAPCSKIHCVATVNNLGKHAECEGFPEKFKTYLEHAENLVGQNIAGFDIPVLEEFLPGGFKPKGKIWDTKILSILLYPDMADRDRRFLKTERGRGFPKELIGRHSLESWGYRLGLHKGTYGKQESAWDTFTPEMLEYCLQDCKVNKVQFDHFRNHPNFESIIEAHDLEVAFQQIIIKQEARGWNFDEKGLEQLQAKLEIRLAELDDELREIFEDRVLPPVYSCTLKEANVLKKNDESLPELHDATHVDWWNPARSKYTLKVIKFNPGSDKQIAWNLIQKYGWKPVAMTDGGSPQISETILDAIAERLESPEAALFSERRKVAKLYSQAIGGANAWNKCIREGRIYGQVNTLGTAVHRVSHYAANLSQAPKADKLYGPECRVMFQADPGKVIVGGDASQVQARGLGHYASFHDSGTLARLIESGDFHDANRKTWDAKDRDQAKMGLYAIMFGVSPAGLARRFGRDPRVGKKMIDAFYRDNPGAQKAIEVVEEEARHTGMITALDGRKILCRTKDKKTGILRNDPRLALSRLLQSFEGIIMKRATVILHATYTRRS